jgi:hypothetical protein
MKPQLQRVKTSRLRSLPTSYFNSLPFESGPDDRLCLPCVEIWLRFSRLEASLLYTTPQPLYFTYFSAHYIIIISFIILYATGLAITNRYGKVSLNTVKLSFIDTHPPMTKRTGVLIDDQRVARQQLCKHIPTCNNRSCVSVENAIARCYAETSGPMDCLASYHVVPQQRLDVTIENVFSVSQCRSYIPRFPE